MTEKRYNARRNEDNDDYRARLKAELEDVIGIVHTDEVTDSVELKKEYYKNQSKDKHYTYLNYSKDGYIGSFYENDKPLTTKEVWDILNEQEELIKRLKTIREEQTETILKQKRKIKELEESVGERITEKQFEIICEDSSLVDVPVYVISDDKLKFDIYGSEKDAERLCTLLNENEQLKKEKQELETRNKRQYEQLKELTELMYERQWEKLENIVEEWEKQEKLLNQEWSNCGDE